MARKSPSPSKPTSPATHGFPSWLAALLIAIGAFALFAPAISHDFINYDDPDYVTQNLHVQSGITKESLRWAFGSVSGDSTYWHPLSWISHMIDCQMFGLKPAGHHAMNILFHSINAALLFLFLRRATGAFWKSALVAIFFAIHPLQVDTVAWVTERKNVLSTCFWFLTLLAYLRYSEAVTAKKANKVGFYFLTLLLFTLGLMCKPMLVTLPCVLLLLDFWPLGRVTLEGESLSRRTVRLGVEKIPFFILSGISAAITIAGHKKLGLVVSDRELSLTERLINCADSYLSYFTKTFWPTHLAIYYPIPDSWSTLEIVTASIFVVVMVATILLLLRRLPAVSFGCLWFLGTLIPVIGILQVGIQAMADRFVYVPIIGLFVAVVWGAAAIVEKFATTQKLFAFMSIVCIAALAVTTTVQLSHWKNSHTLFAHAAKVIKNNVVAEVMIGSAMEQEGDIDGAMKQYQLALQMKPGFPQMHYNIGNLLAQQKKLDAAVLEYRAALAMNSSYADWHHNLGVVLDMQGKRTEAIVAYNDALKIRPDDFDSLKAIGLDLAAEHQNEKALEFVGRAIQIHGDDIELRIEAAKLFAMKNDLAEAIRQCDVVLQIQPQSFEAHALLGSFLTGQGNRAKAIEHFREALRIRPDSEPVRQRLASLQAAP